MPACVEAEGRRQATGVPREAMAPEAEPLRPGRASRAAQPTSGDEGESGTLPDVGQGAAENVLVPQSLPTLVVDSAPIQPPGRYLPHFLPFALAPPAHPRS